MEETNHLIIVRTHSPLYKSIVVFNAKGKEKGTGSGREEDFLSILDEYAKIGYEVINIIGTEEGYVHRAFLRKKPS